MLILMIQLYLLTWSEVTTAPTISYIDSPADLVSGLNGTIT